MQSITRFFRSPGRVLWLVAVCCFITAFATHAGLAALVGSAAGAAMWIALRSRYLILSQSRQAADLEGRHKQAFLRLFNERRVELGPVLLVLIILAFASLALLFFAYGTGVLLSFAFVPPAVWLVLYSEGPAHPRWYAASGIEPLYTEKKRAKSARVEPRDPVVVVMPSENANRPDAAQHVPHPIARGVRPGDDVIVIDAICTDAD